jgi:putative oxidoreductase
MFTFDAAVLVLRFGVGLIFAVHGAQKLFGWWNGPGFAGWQAVMTRMGFRPARPFAAISAAAELVGGLALVFGIATPLAAAALVGQSLVIIFAAHWSRGFFNRDNGYEFPLVLLSGTAATLLLGAGEISVDGAVGFAIAPEVRMALLVVGVLGGVAALSVPRLVPAREQPATQA